MTSSQPIFSKMHIRLYKDDRGSWIKDSDYVDLINMDAISSSGCYYDGHNKLRYRGDIVLRPLISQMNNNIDCIPSSSTECPAICHSDEIFYSDSDHSIIENRLIQDIRNNFSQRRPVSTGASCSSGRHSSRQHYHCDQSYTKRASWPLSWSRFLAMALLVILSFAALIDIGRCQIVLPDQSKSSTITSTNSTTPISNVLTDQNPKDRRTRDHQRTKNNPSDEDPNAAGNWASDDEQDKQNKLSKAAFRQLSRMAFKALVSEDFEDRPLRGPDEQINANTENDGMTPEERRQFRRQQRKLQRQRQRQERRQQLAKRLDEEDQDQEGDLLPPPSDYNQRELIDQHDESSSTDQNDHRLPGRRRAIAIATRDSIKADTCRTVPLKQRVRMTGCTTKIVVSHFCYGQCNSFFIPKLSKKRLRAAFESCSVCRPKSYVPITITLHCPSRNPPYVKRKIMKVKECSCMPAHLSDNDIPQP